MVEITNILTYHIFCCHDNILKYKLEMIEFTKVKENFHSFITFV